MSISSRYYRVLYQVLCHTVKALDLSKRYGTLKVLRNSFGPPNEIHYIHNWNNMKNDFLVDNRKTERGSNHSLINKRKKDLEKSKEDNEDSTLVKNHQLIESLSHLVECSEEAASKLLIKFPFLKKAEIGTIKQKFATLLEEGVAKEELVNDMWILTYSLDNLKERIKLVKSLNCSPIKPWHLRCSQKVLYRLTQNKENNRLAMRPYQSLTDYICERLELTEDQVLKFARKHPPVMRVKVAKLKEVIDFLFSEGFTPNQIYSTPRILCHSLKTTQKRLADLRSLNYEPYSLFILCKSQGKFSDFIKNLKKSESV